MAKMKLCGTLKTYSKTKQSFTKEKMWRNRFFAEINGIKVAKSIGILTPDIINCKLDGDGCSITMKRIYRRRLDEFLCNKKKPKILEKVGAILANLHKLTENNPINSNLPERRYFDFKKDILKKTVIPKHIIKISDSLFHRALKLDSNKSCFVHGDYTVQNIFYGRELIIFDWEHSSYGCASYDIGGSLSFLTTLVLDGGWSFHDYFEGAKYFLDGYNKINQLNRDKIWAIDAFRFLGHREKSQYYLFVIEYLAKVKNNSTCVSFLEGKVNKDDMVLLLAQFGFNLEKKLFFKICNNLEKGGYKISCKFWEKYKEDK